MSAGIEKYDPTKAAAYLNKAANVISSEPR